MKLSTKAQYGMRAMLDLALHQGRGPILVKDIAKRQELSENYLEHLVLSLKAAGLVNSTRGARGGYSLAKPPARIKLIDVIQALEGSLALVECVNAPRVCQRANSCVTRDIWSEMALAMKGVLKSTTLQDLVERQKEKEGQEATMYYI